MAGSRFNTPIQADFINTYTPMPFDQIMQIGQMKQQRYDQGMQALYQLEAQTEMLKYAGEGADKEYIEKANKAIDKLADKYSRMDTSDPFVMREFHGKFESKVDKGRINRIQQSYAAAMKAQEAKQRMYERGDFNPLLDDDPISTWDSEEGIYNWMPRRHKSLSESLTPLMKGLLLKRDVAKITHGPDAGMKITGRIQKDLDDIIGKQGIQWMSSIEGQDQIDLFEITHSEQAAGMSRQEIGNLIMDQFGQSFLITNREGRRYEKATGAGFAPGSGLGLYGRRGLEETQTYKQVKEELKDLPEDSDRRKYLEGRIKEVGDEVDVKYSKDILKLISDRKDLLKKKGVSEEEFMKMFVFMSDYKNTKTLKLPERLLNEAVGGVSSFIASLSNLSGNVITGLSTPVVNLIEDFPTAMGAIVGDEEDREKWKEAIESRHKITQEAYMAKGFDPNVMGNVATNVAELFSDINSLKRQQGKDKEDQMKVKFQESTQRTFSGSVATMSSDEDDVTYVALPGGKKGAVSGIMEVADHVWANKEGYNIKLDGEAITDDKKDKKLEGYEIVKDGYQKIEVNKDGTVSILYKAKKGDDKKEKDLLVTLQSFDVDEIAKISKDFIETGDIPTYSRLVHSAVSEEVETKAYGTEWASIDRFKMYLGEGQSISIKYDSKSVDDEDPSKKMPFLLQHTDGTIDKFESKGDLENGLYMVAYNLLSASRNQGQEEEQISYY